jgi:hypothetical protein
MAMPKEKLRDVLIAAIVIAAGFYIISRSGYVLIFGLGIVCFILLFMWSPRPPHKKFSYEDWQEGVFRVKPFAKLWTPPIPGVKGRKKKKHQ